MVTTTLRPKTIASDGIIDGFVIHQETLDQLDTLMKALAVNLIRQRRWVLVP